MSFSCDMTRHVFWMEAERVPMPDLTEEFGPGVLLRCLLDLKKVQIYHYSLKLYSLKILALI